MRRISYGVSRSVAMLALLVFSAAGWAAAGPLDPLDFASLGAFPSAPGLYTYTFDGTTPILTEPNHNIIRGVLYSDVPGHQIAVFDFDSIKLSNFFLIYPYLSSAPALALLSRGDATINGHIDVSAPSFPFPSIPQDSPSPGGPGGFGSGSGPGAGVTGGPDLNGRFSITGGGGGFGGSGGNGDRVNINSGVYHVVPGGGGQGGSSYGDLAVSLQGGSGGGNWSSRAGVGWGGGGGGAIEIGAIGKLSVAGSILANGGTSSGTTFYPLGVGGGGGGGSGGGIFLHGDAVTLSAFLSAQGGSGSSDHIGGVGGGGGGRVLIEVGTGGFSGDISYINVSGGSGGPVGNGAPGVITITSVPEPASLVLLGVGLVGVLAYARYASRRAAA